jgi:putative ABC transport system permease protein
MKTPSRGSAPGTPQDQQTPSRGSAPGIHQGQRTPLRRWAGVVVRAQSGGRRSLGTALYAGVLLLASIAFTTGWLVRTSVAQRWDQASKQFGSPHLTLTARTGSPLDAIGTQPGVHPIGARTRSMTETRLLRPGRDRAALATPEFVPVEPRMTADTDTTPAGLLTNGRWLNVGAANETVLDVTFARQYNIGVGDKVWLNRAIPKGPTNPSTPASNANQLSPLSSSTTALEGTSPPRSSSPGEILPTEDQTATSPNLRPAASETLRANQAEFTVVGLAVDVTNCLQPDCAPSNLWVHEAALSQLGTLRWTSSVQTYHLDDPAQAPVVAREAFLTYGREMRVATTASELRKLVTLVNGLLGTVVAGFGLFALLASAILISSTTSTRLASLRRDLGLLQVLGATSRSIAVIVLVQNVAIGSVASVFGWGVSFVFRDALVIGPASALPASTPPWATSLGAVILAVLVIIVASTLVPVIRAARLEPVSALRASAPTTRHRSSSQRTRGTRSIRVVRVLPLTAWGLAWQTVVTQRRHFAIAGIALVLTGAAGVTAAGYDAALSGFASGSRGIGVSSDYRIVSDVPAEQQRLDEALRTSTLVEAWWKQTLRPVLVSGQTVQARFIDGSFSDLGLTVRAGRLPTAPGEGVIGYGLATAGSIKLGDIVTVVAEDRTFPIRVVGQVVDGSNIGRSITLALSELPTDTRWAMTRVMRFQPGTNIAEASATMLSIATGLPRKPLTLGANSNRAKPYRLALYAMAGAVMAVGIAQLVASLLLATRARARDLGTLRTLGIDDAMIIRAHTIVATGVALLACIAALPLGTRFYRISIDGISSGVGIGPGVALPSPIGGHVRLSIALVACCAALAVLTVRKQLHSSITTALQTD